MVNILETLKAQGFKEEKATSEETTCFLGDPLLSHSVLKASTSAKKHAQTEQENSYDVSFVDFPYLLMIQKSSYETTKHVL